MGTTATKTRQNSARSGATRRQTPASSQLKEVSDPVVDALATAAARFAPITAAFSSHVGRAIVGSILAADSDPAKLSYTALKEEVGRVLGKAISPGSLAPQLRKLEDLGLIEKLTLRENSTPTKTAKPQPRTPGRPRGTCYLPTSKLKALRELAGV